jgi:hypothetical protein
MTGDPPAPAPGWYADPQQPLTVRYWSGAAWTEHTRPSAPPVVAATRSNGFAVTALVCGILGIVGFIVPFFGFMLNIAAVVFGTIGRRRAAADPATGGSGMATAGLVLGIAGLAITILFGMVFFALDLSY